MILDVFTLHWLLNLSQIDSQLNGVDELIATMLQRIVHTYGYESCLLKNFLIKKEEKSTIFFLYNIPIIINEKFTKWVFMGWSCTIIEFVPSFGSIAWRIEAQDKDHIQVVESSNIPEHRLVVVVVEEDNRPQEEDSRD